ncbi:MAG: haloacid dehalogenase type II, partial [Alphaproteobacteria bacterium]|nr:haloacid dehalogenase type II [Alphaproteobacteria bacterium]
MTDRTLSGIDACVFDAYGTLFDVNSATSPTLSDLGDKAGLLNRIWREKQLQYTWLRVAQGRHADFWQVTGDALDFSLDILGISNSGLRRRLMEAYLTLHAYQDVFPVLDRLKAAGFKLAILSNGTPKMLASAVSSAGLAGKFAAVLSVEEAGVFKPHPLVYRLAVDRFGIAPGSIAFISSNGWDAYAASAFGMRAVWCNRTAQKPERLPGEPDLVL